MSRPPKTALTLPETAQALREALAAAGIEAVSVRCKRSAWAGSIDAIFSPKVFREHEAAIKRLCTEHAYGDFDPIGASFGGAYVLRDRKVAFNGGSYAPGAKYVCWLVRQPCTRS